MVGEVVAADMTDGQAIAMLEFMMVTGTVVGSLLLARALRDGTALRPNGQLLPTWGDTAEAQMPESSLAMAERVPATAPQSAESLESWRRILASGIAGRAVDQRVSASPAVVRPPRNLPGDSKVDRSITSSRATRVASSRIRSAR